MTTSTLLKKLSKTLSLYSSRRSLFSSSKIYTKIEVFPKHSLADERLTSTILSDLKPFQTVILKLNLTNHPNLKYTTQILLQANSNGYIDLSKDVPKCKSYQDPDPMAIYWILKPIDDSDKRFWPSNVENGIHCTYQVFDEETNELLAEEMVKRDFMGEGVQRIQLNVENNGFLGTLFLPPGEGPFPAVINMYGGINRGGVIEDKAAMYASRGLASLALAYFALPGLATKSFITDPTQLEYFEGALDYLLDHPKICSQNGIGITGVSKGGENAMAMGAFLPESKIGALEVLVAPLQYIGAKLTYKNETVLNGHLPTVNWDQCKILNPKLLNVSELNIGLQNANEKSFQPTPFQNCKAPIRFVYGSDDQLISGSKTAAMAENIMKANQKTNYEVSVLEGLGHNLDLPFSPPTLINVVPLFPKPYKVDMGGSDLVKHGRAAEKIWKDSIKYFKKHLH